MTWSLVLGGAESVFDEARSAIEQFGEPDQIVAVKDIWMEWPKVDHVVSYHPDRWNREFERRRKLGYPDPGQFWTYTGVKIHNFKYPLNRLKIQGGSSGLLGAFVGIEVCDRAVLCGIPMDPAQRHFHERKKGRPWSEGKLYKRHWETYLAQMRGKVKSMSGYTKELLGYPTKEWIHGNAGQDKQD